MISCPEPELWHDRWDGTASAQIQRSQTTVGPICTGKIAKHIRKALGPRFLRYRGIRPSFFRYSQQPHHISVSSSVTKTCTHWVECWCPNCGLLHKLHRSGRLPNHLILHEAGNGIAPRNRIFGGKEFYAPDSSEKKPQD